MHSLKELRAENAAKQFSDSRTLQADAVATSAAAAPGAVGAAAAPRGGGALAPIASPGSLLSSSAVTTPTESAQQQEDREARRRRRLRRRRERDERDKEVGDDKNIVNVDHDSTKSRTSPSPREEVTGGGGEEADAVTNANDEEQRSRRRVGTERTSEQKEEGPQGRQPVAEAEKLLNNKTVDDAVDGRGGIEKPQHIARGAPPQEKPRKRLTPLEARRARIEQQKREAERKTESYNESPRPGGSGQRRETLEAKNNTKPEERSGQEHDEENNDGGGNLTERPKEENKKERKGSQEPRDSGGISNTLQGASNDGPEDVARDGRFQGMRNRMKQAGKNLMVKKNPTSSSPQGAEGKHGARGVPREQDREQSSETAEGTSSGDSLSGNRGKDRAGGVASEAGDWNDDGDKVGGTPSAPKSPANGSGSSSNESVLSPMMSGTEQEENGFSTDRDSLEGDKGRRKKWGRNKDKTSTDAPLAGNEEVTLGHVVDRKMREMGYIRKPVVEELKSRRSLRDRVAAEGAPEVHFIGEISGAEGFGSGISCRFRVEGGHHWTCLAGLEEGQTHVMHTDFGETFAPWNHPIDLHYTTKSIQGWPRLMLQVWQLDMHGRNVLRGYGFLHLPSTPGFSELSVPCWRPSGTMQEEAVAFFLGVTPRLVAEDAVFNRAWDQRCRLVTLPAGTVWVHINGLFRNLHDQGVDNA